MKAVSTGHKEKAEFYLLKGVDPNVLFLKVTM